MLGRSSNARDDISLLNRLAQLYGLIEIGLPGLDSSIAEPLPIEAIPTYADLIVEVLEKLGIDYVAALDWSVDGRVGRELISIFPGIVGLAIVGTSDLMTPQAEASQDSGPDADIDASEGAAMILCLPGFDDHALEVFLGEMETRATEFAASPPLWYGG